MDTFYVIYRGIVNVIISKGLIDRLASPKKFPIECRINTKEN